MSDLPMVHFWCGENIETLPREKLLEIIHDLSRQLDSTRASFLAANEINRLAWAARKRFAA